VGATNTSGPYIGSSPKYFSNLSDVSILVPLRK
jgi:hypothetical protein